MNDSRHTYVDFEKKEDMERRVKERARNESSRNKPPCVDLLSPIRKKASDHDNYVANEIALLSPRVEKC